jgi:hypothetical protein
MKALAQDDRYSVIVSQEVIQSWIKILEKEFNSPSTMVDTIGSGEWKE